MRGIMETLDSKKIGEIIRTYRKIRNYTQFKLAEIVAIDEKQLGKIERGVHFPSLPTFLKIVKVLNIDINIFYSDNTQKIPQEDKFMRLIRTFSAKELDFLCKMIELFQSYK